MHRRSRFSERKNIKSKPTRKPRYNRRQLALSTFKVKNDLKIFLNHIHESKATFKNIQSGLSAMKHENFVGKETSKRMIVISFLAILAVIFAYFTVFFIYSNATNYLCLKNEIEVQKSVSVLKNLEILLEDEYEINDEKILPCSPRLQLDIPLHHAVDDNIKTKEIQIHSNLKEDISTTDEFLTDRMRLEYMQRMRVGQFYHRAYCRSNFLLFL